MSRFGWGGDQWFDDNGKPLSRGKLYFYETGSSTPKATYSNSSLTTANTWPVVLDADGRQPDVFFGGAAKLVVQSAAGVQIDTSDPVYPVQSTVTVVVGAEAGVSVETWADLLLIESDTDFSICTMLGFHTPGDGGGGVFYWDSSSVATPDIGTIVQPTATVGAGRWLRIFDTSQINVKWFGAAGDGATDDTEAINLAIVAAFTDQGASNQFTHTLLIPPGEYSVSSVDLTDYRSGRNIVVMAYGVTFIGNTADAVVLDCLASRWLFIHGLIVYGDPANPPKHAIQIGPKGSEACGNNKFFEIQTQGEYTHGAFANYGSETTQYYSCRFVSIGQETTSHCFYGDGQTLMVPTSEYVTVTRVEDDPVSFTNNTFYGCEFRQQAGTAAPVWLSRTTGWLFDEGTYNLSYSLSNYLLWSTATSRHVGLTINGLHETRQTTPPSGPVTTGVAEVIKFFGDGTNSAIAGMKVRLNNPHASDYVFALENITDFTMELSELHIQMSGSDATLLMFKPYAGGDWDISGTIETNDSSKLNLSEISVFTGTISIDAYITLDSLPINGAYTLYSSDDATMRTYNVASITNAPWDVTPIVANALTVESGLVVVSAAVAETVTDIVSDIGTGLAAVTIRVTGLGSVEFVHDVNKIRNAGGVNLVLTANQVVQYTQVTDTVWIQTGGFRGVNSSPRWDQESVTANTLNVPASLVVIPTSAPESVTDIVSLVDGGLVTAIIRVLGSDPVTFVHDVNKIRNLSGANLVIASNQTVQYTQVDAVTWIQTGGKPA